LAGWIEEYEVKKLPIFMGIVIGAFIGLFASISDGLGLQIVMTSVGALVGIAVGGAISRIGGKRNQTFSRKNSGSNIGFSSEDRMNTYWRDKGKIYPMQGHPDPEGTVHDFDQMH
jgi:hypothetical protein